MKQLRSFVIFLLLFFVDLFSYPAHMKHSVALPSHIKVLIDEKKVENRTQGKQLWTLTSSTGFYLFDP